MYHHNTNSHGTYNVIENAVITNAAIATIATTRVVLTTATKRHYYL